MKRNCTNKLLHGNWIFLLVLMCIMHKGMAQQYFNTPVSQFFRDRYLLNPALAGTGKHTNIYGLVNRSWIGFDGAPTLVQFSADRFIAKNAGAGVQVLSDKTGQLQRTLLKASYAYTVHFTDERDILKLGISLSGYREQLTASALADAGDDPVVKSFNDKGWGFDGDFGAVYHNDHFFLSGTLFNINRWQSKLLSNMPVNLETFGITTSYTFTTGNKIELQPLVNAKFYSRMPWVVRAGAEFCYDKKLQLTLLVQNNKSIQAGAGINMGEIAEINFFYSSSNHQNIGQQFEVGLGVHL